jgi:hypothetical protein
MPSNHLNFIKIMFFFSLFIFFVGPNKILTFILYLQGGGYTRLQKIDLEI